MSSAEARAEDRQQGETARSPRRLAGWILAFVFAAVVGHISAHGATLTDVVAPMAALIAAAKLVEDDSRQSHRLVIAVAIAIDAVSRLPRFSPFAAIAMGAIDGIEGWFAAAVITRFCGRRPTLGHVRDVVVLAGAVISAAALAGFSAGIIGLFDADYSWLGSWRATWFSDSWCLTLACGWVMCRPDSGFVTETFRIRRHREVLALSIATVAATIGVFAFEWPGGTALNILAAYLLLPLFIWAGVRFDAVGAMLVGTGVSLAAVILTSLGLGPFAVSASHPTTSIDALAFSTMTILCALVPAAALEERRRIDRARRVLAEEREAVVERLQLTLDRLPIGFMVTDDRLRFTYWNPQAEFLFGYTNEEVEGKTAFETIVPPSQREFVEGVLERVRGGEHVDRSTNANITKAGREIVCEWSNVPLYDSGAAFVGMAYMCQDVTEKRELEERYLQAQKMESVGRLAGGIAHDFNNLLTIVLGNADLAMRRGLPQSELERSLDGIRVAAERGAALTAQLLAFARKSVFQPRIVDLNEVIAPLRVLLHRLVGDAIEIVIEFGEELWPVNVDPSQIEQVLMNMAANARDAMPDGGRLTIRTKNQPYDRRSSWTLPSLPPAEYVTLTVEDTGHGIPDDVRTRLFEPFFTTKQRGKGTGLGLSTCFGIVRQARGDIVVQSRPDEGARFVVYLPRVTTHLPTTRTAIPSDELPLGVGRVLLVEDEPLVQGLAKQVLVRSGYQVETASNGEEAAAIFARENPSFDVVVTDVSMPKMNGIELAECIWQKNAMFPVLFMSGFADRTVEERFHGERPCGFLQKPFAPAHLARKLAEFMARHRASKGNGHSA